MTDRLLHTPEGVRDIYNTECAGKSALEAKLKSRLLLYGYEEIQTPSFEFFDIFNTERGTVSSREMYKFFDREGNTLVLRRILHRRSRGRYPNIMRRSLCRCDFVIWVIHSAIIPVIRQA